MILHYALIVKDYPPSWHTAVEEKNMCHARSGEYYKKIRSVYYYKNVISFAGETSVSSRAYSSVENATIRHNRHALIFNNFPVYANKL